MMWQNALKRLEDSEQWDAAIELMQSIIKNNPDDVDAYLSINFLLMNILTYVHDYNQATLFRYTELIKHYFDESYAKFNNNPEYLFFTAMTGCFNEWYFGLEMEDLDKFLEKALLLQPNNILYKWAGCGDEQEYLVLSRKIIQTDSPYKKYLEDKGSLGKYFIDRMEAVVKKADKKSHDECK